jgi:hypothetical protein
MDTAEILRRAQPSFLSIPNRNAGGLIKPESIKSFGPFPSAPVDQRSHYQAPFPETVAEAVTQQNIVAVSNIYSFQMDDATDKEGPKVRIHDGEVSANGDNGEVPDGMGNDDFILGIANDGDNVWVEVTYDTDTLAITSRTIGTGSGIPDSTLGDAYLLLGYVTFAQDAKGNTIYSSKTGLATGTDPHNVQCGDINIAFMYGAFNGAAALYLLSNLDAPQPIPTS